MHPRIHIPPNSLDITTSFEGHRIHDVREKIHKIKGNFNSFTTQLFPHQHFYHTESHLKFMTFSMESVVQRHQQLKLCSVCIHASRYQSRDNRIVAIKYKEISSSKGCRVLTKQIRKYIECHISVISVCHLFGCYCVFLCDNRLLIWSSLGPSDIQS